jgi:CRISPR-associated protein Cmr1
MSVKMEKQTFEENAQGLSYLLFGMQKMRSSSARRYFAPGSQFDLILRGRIGAPLEQQEKALRRALLATWLLIHLGGIGARSRRAAGSLGVRLQSVATADGGRVWRPVLLKGLPFHLRSRPSDAARQFGEILSQIRQELGAQPRPLQSMPRWEIVHPDACSIWIFSFKSQTSEEASEAQEWHYAKERIWISIMEKLEEFLKKVREEFADINDRAVLGAPLKGSQVQNLRRSSPLVLSVTLGANGQLMGVVTLFRAQLYKNPSLVNSSLLNRLSEAVDRLLRSSFSDVAEVRYE